MSNQAIGATNNRFIGLSSDTKPTDVKAGATFFECNTGFMFIYNGYAWVPKSYQPETTVNYKQISLNQAAAAYDVMTATEQKLFSGDIYRHFSCNE